MLRGATWRAEEIAGTAVFRIVVSSDSMKKATATSHGKMFFEACDLPEGAGSAIDELDGFIGWVKRPYPARTC